MRCTIVLLVVVSLGLAAVWALLQWRRIGPWPLYLVIAVLGWWFMESRVADL